MLPKSHIRRSARDPLETIGKDYRLFLDHISEGIYVIDGSGRVTYVNKAVERRSGVPLDKFVGLHFLDVVSSKYHKRARRNFEKAMGGEKVPPYEVEYVNRDGAILHIEVNSEPIREDGRVIGVLGISRNITARKQADAVLQETHRKLEERVKKRTNELARINKKLKRELAQRKRAEEALRMSEAKFRELAELLPEVVFETNTDCTFTYTNRIGFKKFGYSQQEFKKGLDCFSVIAPQDRGRLGKNIDRLMKGIRVGSGEYLALRRDGKEFPVMIHSNLIADEDGHPLGLRGVMMDISDRKQAEENVLAYQERLRSLASELSLAEERIRRQTAIELHDSIGQTIAFAKMKLGQLRNSPSRSSKDRALDEVIGLLDEAMNSTRSLISELSTPILYEFGLGPAAQWLAQQMRGKHNLRVSFEDDEQVKPLSDDVKVLLFQAVRELLVNVTKHADADHAKVSFMRTENHIEITVSDEGKGFDGSGSPSYVEKTGGFGLFSIRERLDSIGGQLRIKSKPGKGTRVTLIAPLNLQGRK